jgi:hypothetical protein
MFSNFRGKPLDRKTPVYAHFDEGLLVAQCLSG